MIKLKNLKKSIVAVLFLLFLVTSTHSLNVGSGASANNKTQVKNVIMLIPDGTSIEAITLARWYNGGKSLAMDEIAVGLTRTYWKDGPITDSAPGGTAYAVGYKTDDKHVGVLSEQEGNRPVATLVEAARLEGKSTGIVVTSEIMHATPADFTAHDPDRSNYNSLMKQQIYNGLDVVLGGGDEFFTPAAGGKRTDGKDLREVIKSLGYDYVTTRDEMKKSKASKIWGAFAPRDLMYDIDRQTTNSDQPTLAEMTQKAIEVLSKDKDGFFLMVEGSKIDWAAHANDPVGVVSDIIAFDKAVKVALDFARKDGHTVVVSSADHGTGGLTIGSKVHDKEYSYITFDESVNRLRTAKASADLAISLLKNADEGKIKEVLNTYYGINDPTVEEISSIKSDPQNIKQVISARSNVGWTTGGHVGGDVALFNYAPYGVERLQGVKDNTEVGRYMARVLGLNLEKATKELFVNAKKVFEARGAKVEIDASDIDNPVVNITKGTNILKLHGYTNIAELNGNTCKLNGVIVCIKKNDKYNVEDVYVPMQAVELLR
ncbi:alkaline phosphatase [Fonticella tunisiensis]|uniref:Alkaline phosphatase n=1 Tax=Fonticella tunisiensis TaxID=1096341 RepID=A0A4R7KQH2_9CLOT|nr:alkaline phosphatase [Fonticella tunisiensis]TDT61371.1 alkaline phosphatase [Fonticella tunisiensis]